MIFYAYINGNMLHYHIINNIIVRNMNNRASKIEMVINTILYIMQT